MTTTGLTHPGPCEGAPPLAEARPQLADVFRKYATRYRRQYGDRLTQQQDRALREIEVCRTPVLGGQLRRCDSCGHAERHYNSCRNRHCPQCSGYQRRKWYRDRLDELLPTQYQHIIFTLPATLSELALYNRPLIYNLLFTAASQALLHVGRTWTPLQADTGFIAVLHTWGQLMFLHVHLHVLWPAGGLSLDGQRWVFLPRGFSLPEDRLRDEFRTRFLAGLQKAYEQDKLILRDRHGHLLAAEAFAEWLETLRTCYWNLHAKPVDMGTAGLTQAAAAERTLKYLAGYASGVALKNDRLLSLDNDEVTFSYKDYRDQGKHKVTSLPALEFIDRFLLHVLPRHLRHIRNYGFLSHNQRGTKLPLIRHLLGMQAAADEEDEEELGGAKKQEEEFVWACPHCADGVLVLELALPRPSIAQIMRMTLDQLRQLPLPFG